MRNIHNSQDNSKNDICQICGHSFQTQGDLKQHIKKIHQDISHFKCDSCEASFKDSTYLIKHVSAVHEGSKNLKCVICEKTFSWYLSLKLHREVCAKVAPYLGKDIHSLEHEFE